MPEFGRDDCWLFVFQYSFATQRLKLGKHILKCLYFLYCNLCLVFKKIENDECVVVGVYNKSKADRTKWYSVNDSIMKIHSIASISMTWEIE